MYGEDTAAKVIINKQITPENGITIDATPDLVLATYILSILLYTSDVVEYYYLLTISIITFYEDEKLSVHVTVFGVTKLTQQCMHQLTPDLRALSFGMCRIIFKILLVQLFFNVECSRH